jgi:hypothetical protein
MQFDPETQPELPIPDHVPDELLDRYGSSARRTVRRSRTWRYPVARRFRGLRSVIFDGDLWLTTLGVFAWSIVAAGAIGALIYLSFLVPAGAVTVMVPLVAIFAVSVAVAVRLVRRKAREPERTAF